jgi:hypothetical protein
VIIIDDPVGLVIDIVLLSNLEGLPIVITKPKIIKEEKFFGVAFSWKRKENPMSIYAAYLPGGKKGKSRARTNSMP